jgi:aspartate-semialdehyde dehydrogenase
MPEPRIAVVGATGAVGEELLAVLAARGHARGTIAAVASANSAGRTVRCADRELPLVAADAFAFNRGDVVFLGVDAAAAMPLAQRAVAAGARVVDNSSAFRGDAAVPLVIPEVNPEALNTDPPPRLLANPNCSTIMLLVALEPLRKAFGIEHVHVATYQAVSGAGRAAMDELRDQTAAVLKGQPAEPRAFPLPCAFNVFPHESAIDPATLANGEERKIVAEARRIWRAPDLPIDCACTRVPTLRAHCQAVTVTLAGVVSLDDVRSALANAPGLLPASAHTLAATGRDEVLVDRVRWATSELDRPEAGRRRLSLWLAADQLRKGAALNAVQLAEACKWLPARAAPG